MPWQLVLASGAAIGIVIWRILLAITARGGARSGDTSRRLRQVMSQNDAFRVERSDEPWDGVERPAGLLGNTDGF